MGDPITGAIGAIAPIVGGIIGGERGGREGRRGRRALEGSLAGFDIDVPTIEEQELALILPEYIGGYDPLSEAGIDLGPSAMEGISLDPRMRDVQMGALEQLSELGQTGLTEADIAAFRQLRRQAAGESQAQQGRILQNLAERGMGGSGMELAARLSAAQAATDRLSAGGDQLAQMAQSRALQALGQSAGLAGDIRGQEFGEQSDVARSKDIVSQFNIQNQLSQQQRNVAAQNQARLRNLQERQRIGEAQAGQQNLQQQYNKELLQKQFQNRLTLAQGRAGIGGQQATQAGGAAQRAADMWAGIGSGVGDVATAFGQKPEDEK